MFKLPGRRCPSAQRCRNGGRFGRAFPKTRQNQTVRGSSGDGVYYTPTAVVAGPGGKLWVTDDVDEDYGENAVVAIATSGKRTNTFYYPGVSTEGDCFEDIASGPDGALWITDSYNYQIVRMTAGGGIKNFPLSDYAAPIGITVGPDSALWFTAQTPSGGAIGRIATKGRLRSTQRPQAWRISSLGPTARFGSPKAKPTGSVALRRAARSPSSLTASLPVRNPGRSPPAPMARFGSPSCAAGGSAASRPPEASANIRAASPRGAALRSCGRPRRRHVVHRIRVVRRGCENRENLDGRLRSRTFEGPRSCEQPDEHRGWPRQPNVVRGIRCRQNGTG